ncbi:MAG: hypothetical protein FWE87_02710 [Coriobacteriia bacterium]|nr:hypothetical protein [Coriobacteriia bacterium]
MDKKIVTRMIAVAVLVIVAFAVFFAVRGTVTDRSSDLPKTARVGATVIGELSEGYPEAVPKWEGATVVSSDHVMRTDFDVYDLTLATDDPFDVVLNGYLTALQREGFSIRQRDIGTIMTSVEASTTVYSATFVFFTDEIDRTGINASIRTYR